jgi:hypothetical protein
MCYLLDDWIAAKHPRVTDDQDREPLLATPTIAATVLWIHSAAICRPEYGASATTSGWANGIYVP